MPVKNLAPINVYMGLAPKPPQKPTALRFNCIFDILTIELDSINAKLMNTFGTAQAVYVDNSANVGECIIRPAGTEMPLYIPSNCVAMLPFASSEKLKATLSHVTLNAVVDIWLFNVPQPYFCYAAP